GSNVEKLTLTGTSPIKGTGNSLDNILTGNSAANVLTGGGGNDTYLVGAGDTVVENLNGGTDTVQSVVTWTWGRNAEHLKLTGTAPTRSTVVRPMTSYSAGRGAIRSQAEAAPISLPAAQAMML